MEFSRSCTNKRSSRWDVNTPGMCKAFYSLIIFWWTFLQYHMTPYSFIPLSIYQSLSVFVLSLSLPLSLSLSIYIYIYATIEYHKSRIKTNEPEFDITDPLVSQYRRTSELFHLYINHVKLRVSSFYSGFILFYSWKCSDITLCRLWTEHCIWLMKTVLA